jgi:lysophospholipase L1-like esterase
MAAAAGLAAVAAETAWAVLRPSPRFEEFDPSGSFGEGVAPSLRLVVLGDSSVTAPGLDHPDQSWVRLLAMRLADRFRVEIASLAVGGAKSRDVLATQVDRAVKLEPDLALVSVGANDMLRGVSIRTFEDNLDRIVERLRPATRMILLSGVGDLGTIPRLLPPLRQYATARGRAADRVHGRVAARHGAVKADQWTWAAPLFRKDPNLFAADYFHASPAGHAIWAEVAWLAVVPHLSFLAGTGDSPPVPAPVEQPEKLAN